jgi:hypothetical protein
VDHQGRGEGLELVGETGVVGIQRCHGHRLQLTVRPSTRGNNLEIRIFRKALADSRTEVTHSANDNDAHNQGRG